MRPTLAGLALALIVPLAAQAQDRPVWALTCSKGGRIVYRERLAEAPSAAKWQEVNLRNPGAMCVKLGPPDEASAATADLRAVLEQSRPNGNVLSYASPIPPPQGASIDAALRALKGEPMAVVSPPLPGALAMPPAANEPLDVDVNLGNGEPDAPDVRPRKPGWVRLALYSGAGEEDLLADWTRIVGTDIAFAPFSPALTDAGEGRTMLSVGPVAEAERPDLCLAASRQGLDCLPGPGDLGSAADGPAVEALARAYPGIVAWGWQAEMTPRSQGVAPDGGDALACARPWPARRQAVDLVALGTGPESPPEPQRPNVGAGSSASARLSSLPRASTTRSRTRAAAPVIR